MNNLREGKLDIKGIQINEGTQLSDFEDAAKKDNEIEVSKGKMVGRL